MSMVPSAGTGVYVINAGITNSNGAVEVKASDGTVILTYQSEKSCSDLVIASDQLKQGSTYTITQNGTSLGEVTISDTVTYLNKTAGTGQGMFGRGRENSCYREAGRGRGNSCCRKSEYARGVFCRKRARFRRGTTCIRRTAWVRQNADQ